MIRTNAGVVAHVAHLAEHEPGIVALHLAAGHLLMRQAQHVRSVYFVRKGVVKCYITEPNGKRYILELLGEGEMLGELEAFNQTPCLTQVEALTPLEVYQMDTECFWRLLRHDWQFNQLILKALALRLTHTAGRASYQQNYPLEYSILKLVQMFEHQPFELSKQDLANYLGTTVRSLNRSLRELVQRQVLAPNSLLPKVKPDEIQRMLLTFER